jgi:hypothetical protein
MHLLMRIGIEVFIAGLPLIATPSALATGPAPFDLTCNRNGDCLVIANSPGAPASPAPPAAPVVNTQSSDASSGGTATSGSSGGLGVPTGPSLDGAGGVLCSTVGCSDILTGGLSSSSAAYLNAVGQFACGAGTLTCPTGRAPATAGVPMPPPPPSPAVVAQQAITQLNLAAATPHLSADPHAAVGLPVWLWVDRGPHTTGPLSATATVGSTVVTATATLTEIIWSMGPAGAEVTCTGPGTPAPAGPIFTGDNSPDCGYNYTLRSLPERTSGTGKWPVTATSVWTINWAGGGQAGQQTLNLTAGTAIEVGELQAVVVAGGN